MTISSLSRGLLMLHAVLQLTAASELQNTTTEVTENNGICNTVSLEKSCSIMEPNNSINNLSEKTTDIIQCLNASIYEFNDSLFNKSNSSNIKENLNCAISKIQNILRRNGVQSNSFKTFYQILLRIEVDGLLNQVETESRYNCLYCIFVQTVFVLNSSYTETKEMRMEFLKMFLLLRKYLNLTTDSDSWALHFFNVESWTELFNNQKKIENLMEINEDVENELENSNTSQQCMFNTSCVKNCGFSSECVYRPVLLVFYISALVGNGILITIFVQHREMRSERNKIFLNLAICDILSVLCNACLQILYIYGGSYDNVFIYYRIIDLCFEVMIGVSIYTIVALSIQRYLAVSAVHKCNECGVTRYCNATVFICCLWFAGCLPQVIDIVTDMTPRSWILRNLILYCVMPIVATATFYVITSVRLRKSVHKMPGKVTGQETARIARVRSSNVLIALIIVFIVSYAPIQLFRFLEIWYYGGDYLFDYVDLLAYSLLSLNSCFNPIALYVASGTFRSYYNMYLCCTKEKEDTNLSRSDQKQQSTVNTIVLQSSKVNDWKV